MNSFFKYLTKRKLRRQIKRGRANLRLLNGVDLSYMNLSNMNMNGAKLSGSNLRGAILRGTNLQGANLQGANLQGANLSDANLNYVDFTGANLSGANLSDVKLTKTLCIGANLQGANLKDAKINDTTNFTRANMINIRVNENRLSLAIIDDAIIQTQVTFMDKLFFGFDGVTRNKKKIMPISI